MSRPRRSWSAALRRGLPAAALAIALVGCRAERPERVGLAELPARHRALIEAYTDRDPDWPELRDAALEDPELARFLVDNLSASMVQSFHYSAIGSHRAPDSPFRRAQNELVAIAPASTDLLVEMVASEDPILAHLGGETLERIGESTLVPALALLDHRRAEVRRRGAELLGRLPGPADDELRVLARLARSGQDDPEWIVRAQAVRAIAERVEYLPSTGALLQALGIAARDPEPLVAVEAARGLGRVGDRQGASTLIRLLERALREGEPKLWNAAQRALRELAGGGPERDVAGWRTWLAERR